MDLTNCLFQWIKTFELQGNCSNAKDLCDGVAITHALVKIAPEHFSSSLLTRIETRCENSWLRVSNLRRIYLAINDFYSEELDRTIPERLQPDLEAIARDYDLVHLRHLLQLILGCAINCANKETHIEVMTTLSLEVKQGLKIAIDELEHYDENTHPTHSLSSTGPGPHSNTSASEELNKLQAELSTLKLSRESASQRCQDLESFVSKLKDEKQHLKIENERLTEKLLHSSKSKTSSESALRFDSIEHENHFQRLNNQITALQSELARMEEQREDYRINLEIKEKEYHKTLLQVEQLQSKLNEFKHDRDELDRLSYLNDEIIKYKNINEVQKKKLEEFQELKKQTKVLEDRNASLIKQMCELEEEKKAMSVYKGQLELMKKQRDDLRLKFNEESFRADKAQDELNRVHKKYSETTHEKEKLQTEVEGLKLEIVTHKQEMQGPGISPDFPTSFTQQSSTGTHNIASSMGLFKNETDGGAELNEKVIRLEFENDKLKRELQQSNDEKVKLLESQLEDEKARLAKVEAENRANNQRIINLEGQIKEYGDTLPSASSSDEAMKLRTKLKETEKENINLHSLIEKKNEELAEKDERFKKHINKAKETYGQLQTHMNNSKISNSLPDTSKVQSDDTCYWRNQAHQKELELDKLKSDSDKTNAFRDVEERLMTIGFHNLSFRLQRKAAEERIYSNNFTPNPTFMSRQRQASSRKFIIPPRQWFNKYA